LEFEQEAIGLADGLVFGAILIAFDQGKRQRPYALR